MAHHVFILEDDPAFLKLLELRLRDCLGELQLTNASSIRQAREIFKREGAEKFSLFVLDEHLPDGRGLSLMDEPSLQDRAVLSVSSDNDPDIPGGALQAGVGYFLNKVHVSEPLFKPLIRGLIERNQFQQELRAAKLGAAILDTVKTLVGTLRHEINNPLGAVLGAAYLLRTAVGVTPEQVQAAELVEESGKRIKHVLDELCQAVLLDPVTKGQQRVFQVPGDAQWEEPVSQPETPPKKKDQEVAVRLLLVRHGDTFLPGQPAYWLGSGSDPGLAPQATEQAERVRRLLDHKGMIPSVAYSGPLRRHREFTEHILSGTTCPRSVEPRLQELDYGRWAGKMQQEIAEQEELNAWNTQCRWPVTAGWVDTEQVIVAELRDLVAELFARHASKTVLLVSSNGRLRILAKLYASADWADKSFKLKTGHVGLLEVTDKANRLVFWNE